MRLLMPEGRNPSVNFVIPLNVLGQTRELAKALNMTQSELLRAALIEYIAKHTTEEE